METPTPEEKPNTPEWLHYLAHTQTCSGCNIPSNGKGNIGLYNPMKWSKRPWVWNSGIPYMLTCVALCRACGNEKKNGMTRATMRPEEFESHTEKVGWLVTEGHKYRLKWQTLLNLPTLPTWQYIEEATIKFWYGE